VWQHIAEIMAAPAGRTDVAALADCEQYRRGPGLAIVLTDLLTDSDWRRGLTALRAGGQAALGPQAHLGPVERGGEVTLVQILAPEEFSPAMRGDWKLRDAERGVEVEITASSRLLRRYEEAFRAYTGAIQAFCRRQGMPFVQISSDAPVTDVVVDSLYAAGVVG
jgi:hypothetical protein